MSALPLEDFLSFISPHDPCEIADLRDICARAGGYQVCRLTDHQVFEQVLLQIKQMDLAIIAHPKHFEGMPNFWLMQYYMALDMIWWMDKAGIYPHEAPAEHYQPVGYPPQLDEEDRPRPPSTAQTPSQVFGRNEEPTPRPAPAQRSSIHDDAARERYITASKNRQPFCEECAQAADAKTKRP